MPAPLRLQQSPATQRLSMRLVADRARITEVLDSLVGPLGFEPRTDGLKVSGSSSKRRQRASKTVGKTQVAGHLPAKSVHMY